MSLCLRPVIEKWGEPYTHSLAHDEVVNLLCEIAARADAGETWRREYGDLTVVGIADGGRFLAFMSEGQHAMYKARKEGKANYDLTDNEIEAVEQIVRMVSAWRQSIDPDDGFLRIYVD
jgi:hypothetical protein